jgi:mannose-6-phosphate isomerase-like protein (cupin superfamily)
MNHTIRNARVLQRTVIFAFSILVLTCAPRSAFSQVQAQPPRGPSSDDRTEVDVDRYIGNPFSSMAGVTHDVMLTRSILRAGDPHVPGAPGAVLEYRRNFFLATLLPRNRTALVQMPVQQLFYVESGDGRLDDGAQYWDLRSGVAFLIPPHASHRLTNTSDAPLIMLAVSWDNPAGVTARKTILVRDASLLPIAEQNAHWSYMAKNLFHPSDGLHPNEKVLVVYVSPMSIGRPHTHPPHWEEVWTNIGPGDSILQLGSEIREMPVNTAMLVPPNGQTVHAVLNTTRDIQAFFYFGRYTVPAPTNFNDDEGTVPAKALPK